MKQLIFAIAAIVLITTSCSTEHKNEIKTIEINTALNKPGADISYMLENDINVIALQTGDNFLVGAESKKIFTDKHIFIADKVSKRLHMFDNNGTFVKTIGNVGRGAGEYIKLTDFTLSDDSIYIGDSQQNKIIIYPINGVDYREIRPQPEIYYSEITSQNGKLYFITNYSASAENHYNLIALKDNDREYLLAYDKTISEKNQSWGLNRHHGAYKDNTLIIYARNDSIYNLCENKITPRYIANFTQNRLPDDLLKESGMKITMAAYTKGYTTGLNKIYNSKNFIIGGFTEGKKAFNFFYNKLNDSTLVSSSFEIGDLGNLPFSINMEITDNNEIVMTYEAMLFKQIWEEIIMSNSFKNNKNREKIKAIVGALKDDDNPMMIKLKIKEV